MCFKTLLTIDFHSDQCQAVPIDFKTSDRWPGQRKTTKLMISWMNIFTVGRAWNNWRVLNWGQLCNNSSDIWCALLSQQSTPTALSTVLSQILLWHSHSALTLTAQHSPQQLLWHKMQSTPLSQSSHSTFLYAQRSRVSIFKWSCESSIYL